MIYYKVINASQNDIFGGREVRINKLRLVAGTNTATAMVYNASVAGTENFASLKTTANLSNEIDFASEGFTAKYVSVTLIGTGEALYIYTY